MRTTEQLTPDPSVLSAIGVVVATIGGLVAASDLLLGPELLSRTERWLRENVLPITFAAVYESPVVMAMWTVLSSPLILWEPMGRRGAGPRISSHALNRPGQRSHVGAALKNAGREGAFYFFGTSVKRWKQIVGDDIVRLSAYMHFYPRQEYDRIIVVGAPAPWEPTQLVTEIRMHAPGVLAVSLGTRGDVQTENNFPVVSYAEALVDVPLAPGHFVPLPASPLFTPLCDEVQLRALSALRALEGNVATTSAAPLAPIVVAERGARNLIPLTFDVGLWLVDSVVRGVQGVVRSIAELLHPPTYFLLALAFSLLSLAVAGPVFASALALIMPLRACSEWATRRNAQSFLRLFGVALVALGGLLQLV